jgi:hypothetical protein
MLGWEMARRAIDRRARKAFRFECARSHFRHLTAQTMDSGGIHHLAKEISHGSEEDPHSDR